MRTPRLPIVDWNDAPADLNGLVSFAERRNLVSARVPSHFKRSILFFFRASCFSSLEELAVTVKCDTTQTVAVRPIVCNNGGKYRPSNLKKKKVGFSGNSDYNWQTQLQEMCTRQNLATAHLPIRYIRCMNVICIYYGVCTLTATNKKKYSALNFASFLYPVRE